MSVFQKDFETPQDELVAEVVALAATMHSREVFHFAMQLLFGVLAGIHILFRDITSQTSRICNHSAFIKRFALFLFMFSPVSWKVVDVHLTEPEWTVRDMSHVYLYKLLPIKQINEACLDAAETLYKKMNFSEEKWNDILRPPFTYISDKFFGNQIKIIDSFEVVRKRYETTCNWICSRQPCGTTSLDIATAELHHLSGQYTDIQSVILLQLCCPAIFDLMNLVTVFERDSRFDINGGAIVSQKEVGHYTDPATNSKIIAENMALFKLQNDAHSLKNGRSIELVTLTNASIHYLGCTPYNCDVVGAYDIGQENRLGLMQSLQIHGLNSLLIQTLGIFHPITNKVMHCHLAKPCDTGGGQYLVGSDGMSGPNGHFFTTRSKIEVWDMKNVVPIDRTSVHVNAEWKRFIMGNWNNNIKPWIEKNIRTEEVITPDTLWIACESNKKLRFVDICRAIK